MRLPRCHVELPLRIGAEIALPADATRHLTGVLRLAAGAPLILFNGDGHDYRAVLRHPDRSAALAAVESRGPEEPPPPLRIALALGIARGERMDYAIQKAVELGVARILPLLTERGMVRLDGARLERRREHWRGILIGACEQSGRRRPPELATVQDFAGWLSGHTEGGLTLDPQAVLPLAALPRPAGGDITLLIGPEGGLSPRERALAGERGFQGARLGPRILRAETAPLAAIAIIQALWGDFGAN